MHLATISASSSAPSVFLLGLKLLLACLAALPGIAPLMAQQVQDPNQAVRVRMLDGGWLEQDGQRMRLAGIMLELAEGWKTYWRVPGEGGLPPRFDFSGSVNVAEARLLWPTPKRFSDPITGETIGFQYRVVFPVLARPDDPGKPMTLRLKLDYGICGQMCVPMRAQEEITLPADASPDEVQRAVLSEWLAKTPQHGEGRLQIARARLMKADDGLVLEIALQGEAAPAVQDVFVEGVELAVFGKPDLKPGGRGALLARIPVRGMAEEKDFSGKPLRLTIVLKGEKAVERLVKLP